MKKIQKNIVLNLLTYSFSLFAVSPFCFAVESHSTESHISTESKEAFKFEIEKNSIVFLKKELGPYEYLSLSVNGKIIKKTPSTDIFELIERDSKEGNLNNSQKNKLAEEILKIQAKNLKDPKEKEEFEKRIILRGRINGYFDSEKRAYLSLGLKIFPEARIIQPYQPKE